MIEAMQHAIRKQQQAAVSSALARQQLFSIIDGTDTYFMGHKETTRSKELVAIINQRDSEAFYLAARAKMEGM